MVWCGGIVMGRLGGFEMGGYIHFGDGLRDVLVSMGEDNGVVGHLWALKELHGGVERISLGRDP